MNRGERLVRSLSATSVAVLIAAISHVLAGAATPHMLALAITVIVSWPAALWLAGKRLSLARLLALVLGSQALFHVAFVSVGQPASFTGGAAPSGHAHGSSGAAELVATAAPALAAETWLMWSAHAAAAVLTIIALRFGERGAVTLATFVRDALAGLRIPAVAVTPIFARQPLLANTPHVTLRHQWELLGISRRGPPLS